MRDRYYISMKDSDGKAQLFVYDVGKKLWMHEDGFEADCFARVGDELYALSGKLLYAISLMLCAPDVDMDTLCILSSLKNVG